MEVFWTNVCGQAAVEECSLEDHSPLAALRGEGIDIDLRNPSNIGHLFVGYYVFEKGDRTVALTLNGDQGGTSWSWRKVVWFGDLGLSDDRGEWVVLPFGGIGLLDEYGQLVESFVFSEGSFSELVSIHREGLSYSLDRRLYLVPTAVESVSWGQIKSLSR